MTPDQIRLPKSLAALQPQGGIVHATTVVVDGRALMICGPSGSGKSALALTLMRLGAGLIADDRTELCPVSKAAPVAAAPPGLPHAIEARGLGLLHTELAPSAPVFAVLDLAVAETRRLPERRTVRLLGHDVGLIHKIGSPHFPSALMQYLCHGFASDRDTTP